MLTCLVSVLYIFYIQGVLKLKKNNSGAKGLNSVSFRLSLQPDEKYFCFLLLGGGGGRGLFVAIIIYL